MPALPPYLLEPVWQRSSALLLPQRRTSHPLGRHRPRIPDHVVFEKLLEVLVFGCAYDERIADGSCSATTLRDRREEWIDLGAMDALLRETALEAYDDRIVGLELADVAVDRRITKAPRGGEKAARRSPVERGKWGTERSTAADARGIPLGTVAAPANRHDPPLPGRTPDAAAGALGGLPEGTSVHLDRGYDCGATRERLRERAVSSPRSPARESPPRSGPRSAVGGGLLGGVLGRGDHRQTAHPGGLDPLPLGRSSFPQAMTYPRSL